MSTASPEIRLDASLEGKRFPLGSPLACTIRLSNVGERPLWVNGRLLLNSVHTPARFREVWLDIQGPGAQKVDFVAKIRAGAAQPSHYQVLQPSEHLSRIVDLSQLFELAPGAFAFVANYQDGTPIVPAPPHGISHFTARIRSSLVELQIVA